MAGVIPPTIGETVTVLNALRTVLDEMKTDFNAHTHTAQTGAASSGVPDLSITAATPAVIPQANVVHVGGGVMPASWRALAEMVNDLRAVAAELKTDYEAHTHGSVLAGAGNTTGVSVSITATVPAKLPEPTTD